MGGGKTYLTAMTHARRALNDFKFGARLPMEPIPHILRDHDLPFG